MVVSSIYFYFYFYQLYKKRQWLLLQWPLSICSSGIKKLYNYFNSIKIQKNLYNSGVKPIFVSFIVINFFFFYSLHIMCMAVMVVYCNKYLFLAYCNKYFILLWYLYCFIMLKIKIDPRLSMYINKINKVIFYDVKWLNF